MLCIRKSQSSALGPETSISWVTLLWLRLFFPDKLRYRVNCKSYHFSSNLKCPSCFFYVLVSDALSLSSGVLTSCIAKRYVHVLWSINSVQVNPLKPELNPICYFLALLGAHHFLHISRIRVKWLTFSLLMSYIYGAPILDVSRSHTTTQHSR